MGADASADTTDPRPCQGVPAVTPRPALVVVCGLPGVGKTTVARTIADRLGARLVRTDVVRKDLFPDPEYTDAEERAVYTELLQRGGEALDEGRPAVLDGTFHDASYREHASDLAAEYDASIRFVHVVCEEATVEKRIRAREGDESDATFAIHQRFRALFDPLERRHVTVDNSGDEAATLEQVRQAFAAEVEAE
jgi:predicted kinase